MKILKLGIFSGLLAATVLFGSSGAQTLAMAETQESAPADDLQSCAENIKRIYKERYPDNYDVIDDIVDTISSDDEFIRTFEYKGAKAFQIVEDSLRDVLEPTPEPYYAVDGVYRTSGTVPFIMQTRDNYCGPAAVLQALIGTGYLSNTSDNKNYTKQKEVSEKVFDNGSANITLIADYMQEYYKDITPNKFYKAKAFTWRPESKSKVIGFLTYSLQNNGAPIVNVYDTSKFGYYGNVSQRHYVTITEVNTNTKSITVMDPNYGAGLGGTHTITYDELLELTGTAGNLWVAVYTNVGGDGYTYN